MIPNQLAIELENATNELLQGAELGLDRIEELLARRSAVLNRLAATNPATFSAAEFATMQKALRNGESALQKLTLLRRNAASEWQRRNRLRQSQAANDSSISISA